METWTQTCGPIPGGLILTHTHVSTTQPGAMVSSGQELRLAGTMRPTALGIDGIEAGFRQSDFEGHHIANLALSQRYLAKLQSKWRKGNSALQQAHSMFPCPPPIQNSQHVPGTQHKHPKHTKPGSAQLATFPFGCSLCLGVYSPDPVPRTPSTHRRTLQLERRPLPLELLGHVLPVRWIEGVAAHLHLRLQAPRKKTQMERPVCSGAEKPVKQVRHLLGGNWQWPTAGKPPNGCGSKTSSWGKPRVLAFGSMPFWYHLFEPQPNSAPIETGLRVFGSPAKSD